MTMALAIGRSRCRTFAPRHEAVGVVACDPYGLANRAGGLHAAAFREQPAGGCAVSTCAPPWRSLRPLGVRCLEDCVPLSLLIDNAPHYIVHRAPID